MTSECIEMCIAAMQVLLRIQFSSLSILGVMLGCDPVPE
jgi:hypothetical protein